LFINKNYLKKYLLKTQLQLQLQLVFLIAITCFNYNYNVIEQLCQQVQTFLTTPGLQTTSSGSHTGLRAQIRPFHPTGRAPHRPRDRQRNAERTKVEDPRRGGDQEV